MDISVIIAAAGSGTRMGWGKSKALLPLLGRPALDYSLALFAKEPQVREIIVAAPAEDMAELSALCAPYAQARVAQGGEDRCASVAAALEKCAETATHIAVHDAARPLLHAADWQALCGAMVTEQAALLAAPLADTVKHVRDSYVSGHLHRNSLVAAQTPQLFAAALLREAYAQAGPLLRQATDDAALVSLLGVRIATVLARYENFKLTYPFDAAAAEAVLRRRQTEAAL